MTAALIAAERDDRLMWGLHRAAIARGLSPTVPAGVLAETWRDGPQHRLSGLLKGCKVEELSENQARQVGSLIARSGLHDTADVTVAEGAMRRNDAVVTWSRNLDRCADDCPGPGQCGDDLDRRLLGENDTRVPLRRNCSSAASTPGLPTMI